MTMPSPNVAAILLTGGESKRMGRDKAQLVVNGSTLAVRTATLLRRVVEMAVEVGPGVSGLPATWESPPGNGPLAALVAGRRELRDRGFDGDALVLACDLPLISESLLRFLVDWSAPGSVIPIVQGRPQPLCARWAGRDLDAASWLVERGERSVRHIAVQPDVVLLDESVWRAAATEDQFFDVDSPEDLRRLGLTP